MREELKEYKPINMPIDTDAKTMQYYFDPKD